MSRASGPSIAHHCLVNGNIRWNNNYSIVKRIPSVDIAHDPLMTAFALKTDTIFLDSFLVEI